MNHILANKPNDVNTVNIYQNQPIRKVHFRRKSEVQYSRNKVVSRNRGLCSLINCCQKKTNHDSLYSISSIDNVMYNELSVARRANSVNSRQALPIKEKRRGEPTQVRAGNKSYAYSNGTEPRPTKSYYEETVKNRKPFYVKSNPNTSTPEMNPRIQGYYRKNPNKENKIEEARKTVYVYGKFPSSETKHCYTKNQINSFTEKDKNINAQSNDEKEYANYNVLNSVLPKTHYNHTYSDDKDGLSEDHKDHSKNHFDALENYKYVGYVLKSDRQSRSKYKPKEIDIYNNMIENKNTESTQLSHKEFSESFNKEEEKEESKASTEKNLIKNTESIIKCKTNHTNSQNSEKLETTEQDQSETAFSFKKNKTEKSSTDSNVNRLLTTEIENISNQNERVCGNEQNGNSTECKNSKHMKMNIDFFNMDDSMNISITKGNNINVPKPILRKNTVLDQVEQKPKPGYVNHECQTLENYAPKKLMKRKRRIRIIRRIKRKRTMKRKPKKRISLKKKAPVYRVRKILPSKSKKRLPNVKAELKKKTKRKNKFIMKRKPKSKVSQKASVQNDTKKKTYLNHNGLKQHTRKPRNTKMTHKARLVDTEYDERKYVPKESNIKDFTPNQINHNRRDDPINAIIEKTKSKQTAESPGKIKDKETKTTEGGKDLKESSLNKRNGEFMQVVDAYNTFHNSTQVNEHTQPGYILKYNNEYILNGSAGNSKTAPNIYVSIQIDNVHKDMEAQSPDATNHEKKRSIQDLKGTEDKNDVSKSVTTQGKEFIRENELHDQNKGITQVIPPIDIIGYRLKAQEYLKNQINEEFSNGRRINASNATMNSAQSNQVHNPCTNQINNVPIMNSVNPISKELLHRKQTDSLNDKEKNPRQVTTSNSIVEENDISPLVKNLINMLNDIAQGKSKPIESNELEPFIEQPYNEDINSDFHVNQENNRSLLQNPQITNANDGTLDPMNDMEYVQKIHQFTQNIREGKPTSNEEKVNFLLYFISSYSQKLKNIVNLAVKNIDIDDSIFNMKFFILCLVHLVENSKCNNTGVISIEFCNLISDLLDKITKCVIKSLENKVEKYQLMLIKIYLIELLKHTKLLQLCINQEEGGNNIENIQMDDIMKIDNLLLQRNTTRITGKEANAKQDPFFQADLEEEFLRDLNQTTTTCAKRENPIHGSKPDGVNEMSNNQVPYNVIKSKTIHHPVVLKMGNNKSVVSMVNFDIPHEREGNVTYAKTKKENSYKADSLGSTNILHNKNKEPKNIKYKINKLKEEIIKEKVNNSYNMEQHSFLLNHLDYLQEICQGNSKFHLTNEEKLIREEYISHVLERIREIVKKQIRYIEDCNKRTVSTKKNWTSEDKNICPMYENASSCTISPKHTNSDVHPELDSSWFTTEMIHTESSPNVKRIIRNYKRNSNFDETEELNKSLNTIILSKDKLLYGQTSNYYNIIKMYNDHLTLLSDITNDHYISDHETEHRTDDEYFNHMNREQFYNFIAWIKKHKEDEQKIDKSQAIRNFEMTNMKSDMLKNLYSTFVEQEKSKSETKNINYINKMLTVDREDLENSNPFHNLEDTYNDNTCTSSVFNNEDNVLSEYQTFKENGENENVQYFKIGS